MSINMNTQEQEYKKPSTGAIIGGVLAGSAVNSLVCVPHKLVTPLILEKMSEISRNLSADEFSQVEKAVDDTIKNSGLADKGVSIIKATAKNADEINKIITQEIDKGVFKFLPTKVKEFFGKIFTSQMASGKNACYTFKSKKIIMPEKELSLAFFHEAGHAANANLSKFGKALQKSRPLAILALPIAAIALLKTKKVPGEKPKNKIDKTTTFIKENAGKLTFAAFLPTIMEEGIATLKGNKFAKQLLSTDLAKKVSKTNALGFSTYLLLATLSGLGIYLGTKVKDAIAKPELVKNNK